MVSQLQLLRCRLKVGLAYQVGLLKQPYVVADQSRRNDERNRTETVPVNGGREVLPRLRGELLLEVPSHMLEHVGIPLHRRPLLQNVEEEALVELQHLGPGTLFPPGDQAAQGSKLFDGVGHELEFMTAVEGDEVRRRGTGGEEIFPPAVGKETFDEPLPLG